MNPSFYSTGILDGRIRYGFFSARYDYYFRDGFLIAINHVKDRGRRSIFFVTYEGLLDETAPTYPCFEAYSYFGVPLQSGTLMYYDGEIVVRGKNKKHLFKIFFLYQRPEGKTGL